MGFATDAYLGFLTVSPLNLGTAMEFSGRVTLEGQSAGELETIEQVLTERLASGKGMQVSFA